MSDEPPTAIQSRIMILRRALILSLLSVMAAMAQVPEAERAEGFVALFDGKSLSGWDGDPRLWKVEDGQIVGSTEGVKLEGNTFLISEKEYGDFILRARFKLRNHNSGIQIRSEALPNWVVKGLQADMAENNWTGSIYDEKGKRGVMVNGWKGKGEKVFKPGDWNDIEVRCEGDLIQVRLNGTLTAELHDDLKMKGVLAFQLHRGPEMEVRFRDVRIKVLD